MHRQSALIGPLLRQETFPELYFALKFWGSDVGASKVHHGSKKRGKKHSKAGSPFPFPRGERRTIFFVIPHIGAWLSLVERYVRDVEVAGSNPVAPTRQNIAFFHSAGIIETPNARFNARIKAEPMPRQPKPFFRKQTKSWYFSTGGKQIPLGKDRDAAFQRFHELVGSPEQLAGETSTLYQLSQLYLDWCEQHRKPGTYNLHKRYLKSFIGSVGKRLRPAQLKAHHVSKWVDSLGVGPTTQNDAISIVQRMLNWAVEQDYLDRNPIGRIRKPRRKRRDVFYTDDQWKQIKAHAIGPLIDLLDFLYLTGCRPKEARTLERHHIHGDLVIFPADESKGEVDARVIFLPEEGKAILDRLAKKVDSGPLFLNSRGRPWTKDAIKCRLTRISEKVGYRVIAYGARHSFATNALTRGVDPISLAHLMGHRDTAMVSRVYSHVAKNHEFLRQQARNAVAEAQEA